MAEINQPTPIKPVWPTRREQGSRRRAPREQRKSDQVEDRQRRDDRGDDQRPVFDDYA
jgi:hypothetical protein